MVKKALCIVMLGLAIFLTACGERKELSRWEDSEYGQKYQNLTIDELPNQEAFLAMPLEEQNILRLAMDRIPVADYEELFQQAITAYCTSDAVPGGVDTVELVEVTVEKDQLSLISGQNRKPLRNLVVDIELAMEALDPLEYSTVAQDNQSALLGYLFDNYCAFHKTRDFSLRTTSKDGHLDNLPRGNVSGPDRVFLDQPESEYALQTLAFHFAEEHNDFILEKFGALPETKELYIEYYVEDEYLFAGEGSHEERLEANTAKLSDVYDEIVETVMAGDEARTYMEENGLTAYTVAFKSGNWEDEYQLFHGEYHN